METKEKNRITPGGVWALCPRRHAVLLVSLLWLAFYFLYRSHRGIMNFLCRYLVRPWHRLMGSFTSLWRFSLAEWLILAAVLTGLGLLTAFVILLIRRRGRRAYRCAVSLVTLAAVIFGLFCLWWGVLYYSDSFRDQSGLEDRAVSTDELESVTRYFAGLANTYSSRVERDGAGLYTAERRTIFDKSETLYHAVQTLYPCLDGPDTRAKPVVFSRYMSWINYTGFFFPYTAEANVNVDSPLCLLPSTIAHELAHQRGVAGEDEANFVAVLACLESGDADYTYSAALLAYIYLGNALNQADYSAWSDVYGSLNDQVRADLTDNNAYWDRYKTKAADVSEKVYETFLKTYGDDRGMQSYGACVDLLVAYYGGK